MISQDNLIANNAENNQGYGNREVNPDHSRANNHGLRGMVLFSNSNRL